MKPAHSLHILVVEDNDSLREATVDFLKANGHAAVGIMSAEEVDDTPAGVLPDLYLIDVNLPGENGFSLADRIRRSHPLAGIVLMTARGHLSDRLEGYTSGADNYLIKPVEQAELLMCINNLAHRLKSSPQSLAPALLLNSKTLQLSGPSGEALLTQGECILLSALCRAAHQKLERWQAMQLVDTRDRGLVPANLEMRISTLRKKLKTCGAPDDAIITLRGFGYALGCSISVL